MELYSLPMGTEAGCELPVPSSFLIVCGRHTRFPGWGCPGEESEGQAEGEGVLCGARWELRGV